jgi:hypothetical protein
MMRSRLITAAVTLLGLICAVAAAGAANLPFPEGWHSVSLSDFRGTEGFHFRIRDRAGLLQTTADFDGDGRIDAARILESEDGRSCALFLTTSAGGRIAHREVARVEKGCSAGLGRNFYVTLENPSPKRFTTWCGKGAFCEPGDTRSIRLRRPGIGYGFFEASYSIVFWDDKIRSWRTALMSD